MERQTDQKSIRRRETQFLIANQNREESIPGRDGEVTAVTELRTDSVYLADLPAAL